MTQHTDAVAPLSPAEHAELEALLCQLVAINSINPWIIPGAPAEGEIAAFVAERLAALPGVAVNVEEVAPGRPNVLARVAGTATGRHLALNVHTDTVDCASWPETALRPRRDGENLIGLGVADNKAQCAALIALVRRLAANPPAGDVTAIFAADEEGPSIGSRELVKTFTADACIVLEPFGIGQACVLHQGFGSLELVVRGAAAHGLVDDAPDAGVQLAELVLGLAAIDREILAPRAHPRTGKAFFHTAWLRGGTDYGTYPAELTLGFEMGTNPGETLADRLREIEAMIAAVRVRSHPTLDAEVLVKLENDPFTAVGHETLLETFSDATNVVTGAPAEAIGVNTWTDAAIMQGAGIPTIMCGATGGGFHGIDEWVSVPSVAQLVEILERCARRFCV